MPRETFTPTDKVVGQTIRFLREKAGLTQSDLGKLINVTYQQVQKYEKGTNRISLHALVSISKVFDVPLATIIAEPRLQTPVILSKKEQQLLAAFQGIEDDVHKKQLIELAKSLATK